MKFNVSTSIDIQFTEEQIKEALTNIVKNEMPNVDVSGIEWVIKRNPTSVSAKVEASMKGFSNDPSPSTVEAAKEVVEAVGDAVEAIAEEIKETAAEITEEVQETVADILKL